MYRDWILIQDAAWGCYAEPGLFTELGFHWADDDHDDNVFDNDNVFGGVFADEYDVFAISFRKKVKF